MSGPLVQYRRIAPLLHPRMQTAYGYICPWVMSEEGVHKVGLHMLSSPSRDDFRSFLDSLDSSVSQQPVKRKLRTASNTPQPSLLDDIADCYASARDANARIRRIPGSASGFRAFVADKLVMGDSELAQVWKKQWLHLPTKNLMNIILSHYIHIQPRYCPGRPPMR